MSLIVLGILALIKANTTSLQQILFITSVMFLQCQ